MKNQVEIYYSTQSDYCYFLINRLLDLSKTGVEVLVRPVLGGVLRQPQRFQGRGKIDQDYFKTDTKRTADFLGLPYAYPDPSPIAFTPGSLWTADPFQPRNQILNRLFVGAVVAGMGLDFLNHVVRMIWDGSTPQWDQGNHLATAIKSCGLDIDQLLADMPWDRAAQLLENNEHAMIAAGHWAVPLLVYEAEPFYGQDRFDQLLWRLTENGVPSC